MRIAISSQYIISICAAVVILAGCNNGGSQLAPSDTRPPSAVVSTLNAAQPDSIVYTPANVVCSGQCTFSIDLQNNGTSNFSITNTDPPYKDCQHGNWFEWVHAIPSGAGNGIAVDNHYTTWALALNAGERINSRRTFLAGSGQSLMGYSGWLKCVHIHGGFWFNVGTRYLGLEFPTRGKTHYGWAQLSVTESNHLITTTLTGYAYETRAGKSILAGQM